jgi:hypothetical protein
MDQSNSLITNMLYYIGKIKLLAPSFFNHFFISKNKNYIFITLHYYIFIIVLVILPEVGY